MARSVALALLAAAAAVASLQACTAGPGREDVAIQRLQTLLCEKALECGCRSPTNDFGEPIACGEWDPPYVYGYDEFEGTSPVAFDPGCVDRWTTWVEALACQATELPSYAELCPLYHGTLRAGEPCEGYELIQTDCGRGLFCIAGTCHDPLRTSLGGQGEPCDLGQRCDDGLACSYAELCLRLPGPGEPCLDDYRCDAEARCDDELCVALPGPGQRCDGGDCLPGSFCRFDPVAGIAECLSLGDVGDPCQGHRECASGNCPAGACQEPAGVGDPCGSQLPCGPGLGCSDGQCQAGGEISSCIFVDEL
jgi:hypothetical protein